MRLAQEEAERKAAEKRRKKEEAERIAREEAEKKAVADKVKCIETSAKGGYNIKILFRKLATQLPGRENSGAANTSANLIDIKLTPAPAAEAKDASGCSC